MIYVFDLDGTLCLPNNDRPDTQGRYAEARPISETILVLRRLYERGHRIVIHTARRMVTHRGNVEDVIRDVGQVTLEWLARNDVPHHELVFGKPYGDFYVDDKALLPEHLQGGEHENG